MDNLMYAFSNFKEIHLSINEYEKYNLNNNAYMIDVYKYLKWRKINLLLMLPLLLTNFILNIFNYKYLENNLLNSDNNYNNSNDYFGNIENYSYKNMQLDNKDKTILFNKIYFIFIGIIIAAKFVLISFTYLYNDIFLKSKLLLNITLIISIIWIYLVYINPLNNLFKIKYSDNSNNNNYSKNYIIIRLLTEIIPITIPFLVSLMWSFRNLKIIIPNNIILGWFYEYSLYIFMITGGTILLIINQFIDNYFISVSIFLYLTSVLIGFFIYRKDLQIFYSKEDSDDLIQYNFNLDFIINITLVLVTILSIIYMCKYDLYFDEGIYKFSIIDYIQFFIKYLCNILFFRIIICDNTLTFLLYIEKYKLLVKSELEVYNQKMINIETRLYNNYITTMNAHNGYNSMNSF